MAQRSSISNRNTTTRPVSIRSTERMPYSRPRRAQTRHQGIAARHTSASRVPTALACNECRRSPWTSRAKLVVMPHDGQGSPVTR